MSNIGLLFGSFNPIHRGHIYMAIHSIASFQLDEVWFVVAKQNPFKEKYEIADEHRIEMCSIVCKNYDKLRVCKHEFDDACTSNKTFDVIEYIKFIYPQHNFVVICGSDSYLEISGWHRGIDLLKYNKFIVFNRSDENIECAFISNLPHSIKKISSTLIRNLCRSKKLKDHKLVIDSVLKYIKLNKLYVDNTKAKRIKTK